MIYQYSSLIIFMLSTALEIAWIAKNADKLADDGCQGEMKKWLDGEKC